MRGLFLKIFAILWLAQSLIFLISTALIVRQRFMSPNLVFDALDSNLRDDADAALAAYEAQGCAGFANNGMRHEPSGASLVDEHGDVVCATAGAPVLPGLVNYAFEHPDNGERSSEHSAAQAQHAARPARIDGRLVNGRYVWIVPVAARTGAHYEYVWFQPPPSSPQRQPRHGFQQILHFAFPQIPVAIAVYGATTFVLVLLFSRPLVRLRRAARELAGGNLSARVDEPASAAKRASTDEFQGLVHDFNHMAERLESLVGAQRLLLRDVSHELRSPLARLSVALELAREDAEDERGGGEDGDTHPELAQHLDRIEREADNLNKLIGQLLTLSSMEAREDTAAFKPVSLNRLCEELLPDAEYEAQQRPCGIVLEQDAECTIAGDYELLYRAIENVVRNAIRYTGPDTLVTVRVGEVANGTERMAMVEVSDRGPGIPEADLAHIFRPFYRVDASRTSSTGGSGVGLAITERAVRLHRGSIRAMNREQGGTVVQMKFPLVV